MSRSRRKTPVIAITCAESDKPFKTQEHRRERCAVRAAIANEGELPAPKAFGDPWNGLKDGKLRLAEDCPDLMRK